MGLSVKVGNFVGQNDTLNQPITGVGFQPKLVIIFGTDMGATGSATGNVRHTFGAAASSSARWAMSFSNVDAQTLEKSDKRFLSTRVLTIDYNGTVEAEADFVSMDSDGFTIDWITADNGTYGYIAIGGTDFSVAVGTLDSGSGTGNKSVSGLSFQPACVLLAAALAGTTEGSSTSYVQSLGAAISSSSRWVMGFNSPDGADPTNNDTYWGTSQCLHRETDAGVSHAADFVSHNSDGFTLNYATNSASARLGYIAMAGCQFKLDTFTQLTSNSTQEISGVGFQPTLLMFMSPGLASSDGTRAAHIAPVIGAMTGSSARFTTAAGAPNGQATTDNSRVQNNAAAIHHLNTASPPATAGVADFSSFNSDGFTLSWTSTDGVARQELYLAIAATAAAEDITIDKWFKQSDRPLIQKPEMVAY